MNIAIFASGRGTNFSALIKAREHKIFKANLSLLISDNPGAGAIIRAKKAKIPVTVVERGNFKNKEEFEKEICSQLSKYKIDLIVLAGFMCILSANFVKRYEGKIINIHPALLPAFKGGHAIKDAFDYGAKVTGVTVHFVDQETDHGPIILQEAVEVKEKEE